MIGHGRSDTRCDACGGSYGGCYRRDGTMDDKGQVASMSGVAWMTLGEAVAPMMRLYKVLRLGPRFRGDDGERCQAGAWRSQDWVPACARGNDVHGGYDVRLVERDKLSDGFAWARVSGWPCWGVWHRGHPGLIWSPDFEEMERAFASLAGHGNAWVRDGELLRAPVRYSARETGGAYPFVRSTRSRVELWRLRSRYPSAIELAYVPTEALRRRDGGGAGRTGGRTATRWRSRASRAGTGPTWRRRGRPWGSGGTETGTRGCET